MTINAAVSYHKPLTHNYKETYPTLEQIAAVVRRTMREELRRPDRGTARKPLSDEWVHEKDALVLCGKTRKTLLRAIETGRIKPADLRPNPIGTGYLIRRTALVADKPPR